MARRPQFKMNRSFPTLCRTFVLFVLVTGNVTEAAAPSKTTDKAPATTRAIDPPLGFWSDQRTNLYFLVEAGKSDPGEAMSTENRRLQLGGPPPSKNKADNVFDAQKCERRGNTFVATGTFNWDSAKNVIEVEITWTAQSVTVKIVTNPGYEKFPVGTYVLKRQKR